MKTIGTLLFASFIGVITNNTPYITNIEIEYNRHSIKHTVKSDTMPLLIKTVDKLDSFKILERGRIDVELNKPVVSKAHSQYIIEHMHLALEVEKIYGIPAELCLAQAIHESGGGTSWLARNANNHFGVKAGKGQSFVQPKQAKWRKYESVDDSYMDYGRCVTRLINGLYPKGWTTITPLDIAKTPYAGKNNWDYAVKCDKYIRDYNLKELVKLNSL